MKLLIRSLPIFTLLCMVQASPIAELEGKLLRTEREMLESELKKDQAIVELWEYRGIGGWFHGKEKKALKKVIREQTHQTDSAFDEIQKLEREIQSAVFEAGYSLEQKGEFEKALEFYFQVERKTDEVKLRIASCYKGLGEFETAITWVLKMTHSDQNFLHVVELYHLAGNLKEAVGWLFRILRPLDGNPSEDKALELIELYDYEGREHDFPMFHAELSDVYVSRALNHYSSDFEQAKIAYQKAAALRSQEGGSEKSASRNIVRIFRDQMREAREILENKRKDAQEHYQYKVRRADEEVQRRERRLNEEYDRARRSFQHALYQGQEEVKRARRRWERVQRDPNSTAQQMDQAKIRYDDSKRRYRRLQNSRDEYIEEQIRPYRAKLRRAREDHRRVVNSRSEIIEGYIEQYRRNLSNAERRFEQIEELHHGVFDA